MKSLFLPVALLTALPLQTFAQKFTIEAFDPPNSTRTVGVGINAGSYITGFFDDSKTGTTRGFLRYDNGNIVVFDVPGSDVTGPAAINSSGKITGGFRPRNGPKFMGFVRDAYGKFVTFDSPDGVLQPTAINDLGAAAGVFFKSDNTQQAFLRDAKGQITYFAPGGATSISAGVRINNPGQITGSFVDRTGSHGFLRDRQGNLSVFDVPRASFTLARGINSPGQLTGVYYDSLGVRHGFLRQPAGDLVMFDVPGALFTEPVSINDFGQVTGIYQDSKLTVRGFVRDDDGRIGTFEGPNASETSPSWISLNTDMTVSFKDSKQNNRIRGLVAYVESW